MSCMYIYIHIFFIYGTPLYLRIYIIYIYTHNTCDNIPPRQGCSSKVPDYEIFLPRILQETYVALHGQISPSQNYFVQMCELKRGWTLTVPDLPHKIDILFHTFSIRGCPTIKHAVRWSQKNKLSFLAEVASIAFAQEATREEAGTSAQLTTVKHGRTVEK